VSALTEVCTVLVSLFGSILISVTRNDAAVVMFIC